MAETECERVEWVVLGVAFLPGHGFQSIWGHLSRAELVTAASEGQLPASPGSGPGELLTLLSGCWKESRCRLLFKSVNRFKVSCVWVSEFYS